MKKLLQVLIYASVETNVAVVKIVDVCSTIYFLIKIIAVATSCYTHNLQSYNVYASRKLTKATGSAHKFMAI